MGRKVVLLVVLPLFLQGPAKAGHYDYPAEAGHYGYPAKAGLHFYPAEAGLHAQAAAVKSELKGRVEGLPDEQPFFNAVRDNMARANRDQHRYAYKERRTELHTNPFGRLGTGDKVVYEVTPGPAPNIRFRRLLEKNGKPVSDSEPEKQEARIRTQGRSAVDDTVATLQFSIDRRDSLDGRRAIVVRFAPRKDASPQTREGKLAKGFSGLIWVDEAAHEVMKVEATAIDDLSYGLGLLARLRKGGVVTLTRERIDDHIWLPTSIRFKADGRALLSIRKLNIDFAVEWFDYRRTL